MPSLPTPLAAVLERMDFVPVVRSGGWSDIGRRPHMEDVHIEMDDMSATLTSFGGLSLARPRAFYGVFDGHGGRGAASFVSEHLLRHIVQDPAFPDEMTSVFQRAFERTDMDLEASCSAGESGTTALTVLINGSSLVVANAGDCRAVLSRRGKALDLSRDQKPNSKHEKARIEAAGGFVDNDHYLNGQLGVARALGDWHLEGLKCRDHSLRPLGPLTSEPEVREATLTPEDEFLILGCDGLWDVFTSQNAVDFARRRLQDHNDPEQCSRELVAEALRRETSDNLTVVTVCLGVDSPPILKQPWRSGVKKSISVDGLTSIQAHLDSIK